MDDKGVLFAKLIQDTWDKCMSEVKLTASEFMNAYDMCSSMAMSDQKFTYDIITDIIRSGDTKNERYMVTVRTFSRLGSYLQRFYIPINKLSTFIQIGEETLQRDEGHPKRNH